MPRGFSETERRAIRARLEHEGRKAIARVGLRRLRVDDLVKAAGISKGAFYLFFASKEALVLAVLATVEAEARAELERRLQQPAESSRELIARFLRYQFEVLDREPVLAVLTDPEEAAVLLRSITPDELGEREADDDRYFVELFARWQADGILAEVDTHVLAGLPRAALALLQQREMIGSDRFAALVELVIDSLARRLAV